MKVPIKNIPTFDNDKKQWSTTSFDSQKEFADYLLTTCFKEPGEYGFDETVFEWNRQAEYFNKNGFYTPHAENSNDYFKHWDSEELKSRLGVIWKSKGKEWYTTRDYYFLLNYCPIINKEIGNEESFASVRDVQYHMMLYEKIAELLHKHSAELKKRQMLYEQPHSSLILGKDGWTTMGDVQIGDEIRNPDGNTCKIISKSQNGFKDIYSVELSDGQTIKCGENHLWEVIDLNNKKLVLKTSELISKGLSYKTGQGYDVYKFLIESIRPVVTDNKELLIDPYVLGVLIGDGGFSTPQVNFTTYDDDISIKVFKNLGNKYESGYKRYKDGISISHSIVYKDRFKHAGNEFNNSKYGVNPLIRNLDKLGLLGKTSTDKFIPEEYFNSSIEQRIQLLQGLFDTDGYINKDGLDIHFTTISKQLATDVWRLLMELGCLAEIATFIQDTQKTYYRVRVKGNIDFNLFYCIRKYHRFDLRKDKLKIKKGRKIVSITNTGSKEECSCIMVDNPNHLYITDGYTITHNSYCHVAKILNFCWFENKKTMKMLASDDAYINDINGSWKILNSYKNHLNQHTGWVRIFTPDGYSEIQQKEKIKVNGKWVTEGNESTIVAKTLKRDVTSAVGGPGFWIWHEEGGIAPKADDTLQYLEPALSYGNEKSGSFCIGGSVGDLDACKPLKQFLLKPELYDILAVPTKWYNETGERKLCGLFIPEQYGFPQAVDEFGNSQVEKALEIMAAREKEWEKLPPKDYVLKKSQSPRTIKEAFAWRKQAFFNVQRIERRQEELLIQLKNGIVKQREGLLYEDKNGEIKLKELHEFPEAIRPHVMAYPIDEHDQDKRGCVTIWESPEVGAMNLYYAGVDPIGTQDNYTSNSVFSMHIYKRGHSVVDTTTGDRKTVRGKIVASYRGRFKSVEETNEMGLLLLRLYKAKAACERNKDNFINYCRRKGFSSLIARKNDLPFDKDIDMAGTKNDEFGVWKGADGNLEKILKKNVYEYLEIEVDTIHKKTKDDEDLGDIVKTIRGYQLVNDYWMLEEYKLYNDEDNFDSFISSSLAISYGVAAELTYEKKIYTQSEPEKPKTPPKPKIRNMLGTYGQRNKIKRPNQRNNRSQLNY